MNCSLVISPMPDRLWMLKYFLPIIRRQKASVQLVIVDDSEKPLDLPDLSETLEEVKHLTIEHDPSVHSMLIKKLNCAVRACDSENILYSHLECLLLGTLESLDLCQNGLMHVFPTFKTTREIFEPLEKLDLETCDYNEVLNLPGIEDQPIVGPFRSDCWWWFAALFKKQDFLAVGGLDERLCQGEACEDDAFAYCWMNSGREIAIPQNRWILHLWHEPVYGSDLKWYAHNLRLSEQYRKYKNMSYSNPKGGWGETPVAQERVYA